MTHDTQFFIGGRWVDSLGMKRLDVIDPATEQTTATIALGSQADVDRAVGAACEALPDWSSTSAAGRAALLMKIADELDARKDDFANAICREIGAPLAFARDRQAAWGPIHLRVAAKALESFEFERRLGNTLVCKEPIGVAALITPWNWPVNQISSKIAPALAAGCTVVLKPSELSPLSAIIWAEVMEKAGVPAGVFNLIQGNGEEVGTALSRHPCVDMVSFTGSTRAGILVAKNAADTVKRVTQELGGKSANILLPDVDFDTAVRKGVAGCFNNSGQSCGAPTRMLVPAARQEEVISIAAEAAVSQRVGPPRTASTVLGPVANRAQFDKTQRMIAEGLEAGATLVAGGLGRPDGLTSGFYVRPTIFANVSSEMTIAREEIFGPVLSIIPYLDVDDAVRIANDSSYGLAAHIQGKNLNMAHAVARRVRAGSVRINYPPADSVAPYGGYKMSGNGREYGVAGIEEFLETKSIIGYWANA